MNTRLTLLVLIFPMYVHGDVLGNGEIELGLSKDESNTNFGLAASYDVRNNGSTTNTMMSTKAQLGSDEGRSLVATAAHEYQYEQSFIRTEINNTYNFYYPGLLWQSQFSHNLEFKTESITSASESNIDFENPDSNWSLSIGPSFTYDRSKWLNYRSELTVSRSEINDENSTEGNAMLGVGKRLSAVTSSYFDVTKICTQYENVNLDDICRNELRLSFFSSRSNAKIQLEIGLSEQDNIKTNLYLYRSTHSINSSSSISIELQKDIVNLNNDNAEDLNLISTIKEGQSLFYQYDWGRQQLEIKARALTTIAEDTQIKTKDASIFYSYQLGSKLCIACSLGANYEYSDYGNDFNQIIQSIAISKVNSRRISSSLSFRRTKIKSEIDTWSINLLLSYKGLFTKLGKR